MIGTYKTVWDKRDLIAFLVRHERRATVSGTLLGHVWYLILPVAELFIYYLLIVVIFQRGADYAHNPFVSITIGIMHYLFLQNAAKSAMESIHSRRNVLLQIKMEPVVLAFAAFREALLHSLPAMVLALGIWAVMEGPANLAGAAFYPLILLVWIVFGWALGFFLATATVFVRDLEYFVPIILRLLMYVSPVLYPLTFYPQRLETIALLNPVASIFGFLRWSLLGDPRPRGIAFASIGVSIALALVIAHLFYIWARPRFTKVL